MKKFEVCIRGDNFKIKREDTVKKNNFYAARFVEANNYSDAVDKAMESFRAELKDVVMNDKSDPPKMKVVDVKEVYYFEKNMSVGELTLPPEGFVWDEEWDKAESASSNPLKNMIKFIQDVIAKKDFHVHSISIHFTNALYPVAILFMFLYLLFENDSFHKTFFYMMLLATVSVPVSYATGILEWRRRYQGAMIPVFIAKIRYGVLMFIIGGTCTVWHYLSPGILQDFSIISLIFIILTTSILLPLVYLGHIGGIIVYQGVDLERGRTTQNHTLKTS